MQWECEECGQPLETMSEEEWVCRFCGASLCFNCYQNHKLECEENEDNMKEDN
jgi:hypothetical protein